MLNKYIETSGDINVEGIEFYVSEDGYLYIDKEFTKKVSFGLLKHSFEMNDVVIIDDDVVCRPVNMNVEEDEIVLSYIVVSGDPLTVTPKSIKSAKVVSIITDTEIAADEDLFGKFVADLQNDIEVKSNEITGTLKYVSDYTGFSSKTEEQSGNYLAIHNTTNSEDDIYVEIIGGYSGPVKLDSDGIIILRIANNNQIVRVTVGDDFKEYSLKHLVLTSEE